MEINGVTNIQSVQVSQNTAPQSGAPAVQTVEQRQDFTAQRVVSVGEKSAIEQNAARSEEKRFEALKGVAVRLVGGDNPYFNDYVFTIYKGAQNNSLDRYYIRFTDISTGRIETKSEVEVFQLGGSSGNVVSGSL